MGDSLAVVVIVPNPVRSFSKFLCNYCGSLVWRPEGSVHFHALLSSFIAADPGGGVKR